MNEYAGQTIVVVGAGDSGRSLARFFLGKGARTILSERRPRTQLADLDELETAGVILDCGGHSVPLFTAADLVVVSPGVPQEIAPIQAAMQRGVPVLGEVEIARRELTAPLIGITGTNGKSTVTTLIGEMLRRWGQRTFVGGNLGTPLIEAVDQSWDWLVVELSSFQLEAIRRFRPDYGLLLNLSADHLDRYPDMTSYRAAKLRLFENMTAEDIAVLNADDPEVAAVATDLAAQTVWFSSRRLLPQGMGIDQGEIVWRWQGAEQRFVAAELQIGGQHNLENVMAALIPPLLAGCPAATAWQAATLFTGLPHRMQLLGERGGVRWYDDSKGTNVGSVVKSLEGLAAPVTLIAGGKDKQGDLMPLTVPIAAKVETLVLIGEAAERMAAAFAGLTRIERAGSMEAAVAVAARLTPAGGSVLLSPGCSSFDMFRDYRERGERFAAAFRNLPVTDEGRHGD
ncbi:MAG: UDP-N-acetylmuramoyl-L-alanine--D-glutamate ligase [Desulfuromonadales bacterium]|nr:UDP-N-acetylmuramoyl-L-alanine--D-glutamate ligase [Desulfuromonadales bacterium]